MKATMIRIDGNALKNELIKRNVQMSSLSVNLGYASNYITNSLSKNRIRSHVFRLICEKHDFDAKTINMILRTNSEPTLCSGLEPDVRIDGEKLRLTLLKNGVELHHATAIIKGDDDLAIAEAVSSAAYMIYKLAEQKKMEE